MTKCQLYNGYYNLKGKAFGAEEVLHRDRDIEEHHPKKCIKNMTKEAKNKNDKAENKQGQSWGRIMFSTYVVTRNKS